MHKVKEFASWLGEVQRSLVSTRVLWRGLNPVGWVQNQDAISRHFIEQESIQYFDVHPFFVSFQGDLQDDCCSDRTKHGSVHVGGIAKYYVLGNAPGSRMTISSIVTQGLLGTMFNQAPLQPHRNKKITPHGILSASISRLFGRTNSPGILRKLHSHH